jgi:hypothetical protein
MNITKALKNKWLLYARRPPSPRAAITGVAAMEEAAVRAAIREALEAVTEAAVHPVATVAAGPRAEAV